MRVLLVEDNFIAALDIVARLEALGCTVIGPVGAVSEALEWVERETFQGALLDATLRDGNSVPVALALQSKGCKLCFITGYSNLSYLPDSLKEVRCLTKPIDMNTLQEVVAGFGAS